jgi:hypothetical protein
MLNLNLPLPISLTLCVLLCGELAFFPDLLSSLLWLYSPLPNASN